ncbi:hypothetical protein HHI36_009965 [Cryptolaemus montrouzieri]|uniref:Uncharacterized protein n=1 Tax=Cryptolaemus montrouzieri TaxID=559131 RepID=A0ABD2MHC7_9CUCU
MIGKIIKIKVKFLQLFFTKCEMRTPIIKGENRALRLKETPTVPAQYEDLASIPGVQLALQGSSETTDGRLTWNYFDEEGYISRSGLRQGEDPYVRNRFNQEASDNLPSNREVADTRNPM